MKKLLSITLATLVLMSFGSVFAETSLAKEGHEVTVYLPKVAFLRFTPTVTSRGVYNGPFDLVFDVTVEQVEAGVPIARSNTDANWGDLKVFTNSAIPWTVTAKTSGSEDFNWSKIATSAFSIDGGTAGTGSTNGWTSLGFGAADLLLTLDGSELAGEYKATVTYTLTAP